MLKCLWWMGICAAVTCSPSCLNLWYIYLWDELLLAWSLFSSDYLYGDNRQIIDNICMEINYLEIIYVYILSNVKVEVVKWFWREKYLLYHITKVCSEVFFSICIYSFILYCLFPIPKEQGKLTAILRLWSSSHFSRPPCEKYWTEGE